MTSSIRITKPAIAETFKDESLNIRKVNVGEINPKSPFGHGKVLMLLGATGTGKSTLINGFVNYIRGVTYKDDYRYKLVGDEGPQSQAHSQTKWITTYTFEKNYPRLPYRFTIIDTPGYGDTEGIERDNQITKQIKEFFSIKGPHGIDHIDGIGFVVQASSARLTPTQKYIFDSILSMFGKDISKNIFVMVTFADNKKPPVLEAIRESGFEYQQCFKFNNSALFPDKNSDDDDDLFNEMFWKMGEKSFENFFRVFRRTKSVSLQLTNEVLHERENLECLIQGLQKQIQVGLSKVDQLQQEESMLQKHQTDMETNKGFTYKIEETRQRKVDLDPGEHVTNCLKCHFTCHYPCRIPKDEEKYGCAAMNSSGNCNACTMNCHWSNHVNNSYQFEMYTVIVSKTSGDMKIRYVNAQSKTSQKQQIMNGISRELETMYNGVYYNIHQARVSIQRLEEIALRPNPLSEVDYINILIKSEELEAKPGWTRRVDAYRGILKQATTVSNIKNKATHLEKCKGAARQCWQIFKVLW